MKQSLNKEIASKAYQCHYARCSYTTRIVWCTVDFLFLVTFMILIPIRIVGEAETIDICFLVIFCFILIWELEVPIFRDVHWIKKLFNLTNIIDVEIELSDIQVQIKYNRASEVLKLKHFTGWLETNGLLLLYRRKRFFDLPGPELFDVIDLSQISQEEKASFTEMLSTNVNIAPVPSNLFRVRLTPVTLLK